MFTAFVNKHALYLTASSIGIASLSSHLYTPNARNAIAEPHTGYTKQIQLAHDYVETERLIQGVPGITVAVIKDNQLIWSQGFGYIDIENRIVAHPYSLMRIASISKSITSSAIGLLLQRNKLNLSHTIQHYLPEYPLLPYKIKPNEPPTEEDKDKQNDEYKLSDELCDISLEQLCCHQSGIRDYKEEEFLSAQTYLSSHQPLDIFKNDPLEFKPATDYLYSTYNYCVLQAIIEKVVNTKFIHFMQNEIFDRLKMHNTYFETNENIFMNRSKQYTRKEDEKDRMIQTDLDTAVYTKQTMRLYHTKYVDTSNKYAGGGLLSTCTDVALFGNEIVFGTFLDECIKKQLFFDVDNEYNYGLGWGVYRDENKDIIEISHSGGAVGGCSYLLIIPKERIVVALLMNLETGNPYIARQIAKYFKN